LEEARRGSKHLVTAGVGGKRVVVVGWLFKKEPGIVESRR
jgi:hypothetical protein